ncbi:hypothetical protein J3A83DRAFT_4366874 [Scleroderma citrinum]
MSLLSNKVFDFCLTLSDEVRLLGSRKRWDLTHILYILTRYFPVISALCAAYNTLMPTRPEVVCVALYTTSQITIFFAMSASEALLLFRTLALWHTQKLVRIPLIGIFIVVVGVMFVCTVISSTVNLKSICPETPTSVPNPQATKFNIVIVGACSSAAFFELVIIFYTILYGSSLRARTGLRSTSRLVSVVTQGNMLYALSLFVVSIVNITFYVLPLYMDWNGLFINFQCILHGVMAARILFELRDALSDGSGIQTFTGTGIVFASRFGASAEEH